MTICNGGVCHLVIYSGLTNYWNGTGYTPINTTINTSYNTNGYDYAMVKSDYHLYIKAHSNWGDGVEYCVNDGGIEYCLTYQSQDYSYRDIYGSQDYISSISDVAGVVSGNSIIYPNAFPYVNLSYVTYNALIKENYVVRQLPRTPAGYLASPITLDFGGYVKYPGLTMQVNGVDMSGDFTTQEQINFVHNGKVLFYLPKPYAYDSNNTYDSVHISNRKSVLLTYEVKTQGSQIWFYVRTPYAWLSNSSIVYPVYIDPTITINDTSSGIIADARTAFAAPDTNFGTESNVYIQECPEGAGDSQWGYFMFNLTSIPAGATITDANLSLYVVQTDGISTVGVNVSNTTGTYTETGLTWNTQPPAITVQGSNFTTFTLNTWMSWNVTNATVANYNNPATPVKNASFLVKYQVPHVSCRYVTFASKENATTATRPQLNVTYTSPPPPQYSNNQTNSTLAGTDVQHDLEWVNGTVGATLSGYNFSWCNGTYLKSVPNYQTTTYNFLDNVSNNAYWASPANPIAKPSGGTRATAVQYVNMSSNNSAYARAGSDATNDDPYWSFNFTINDTRSTVNWVNITLGGFYNSNGEVATCYAWNDTSGTYISLGNLGTTPTLLTVNYSTQQQTLINSTTKVLNVQCTGISFDSGEYVYIDFVSVNVGNLTYSAVSSDCSDGDAILTNDSWTAFTSGMCPTPYTDCWSNVSKVINSTAGSIIKWCFSVNDSDNQWNSTSCTVPFNYTTTQGAQNYPKILYDYSTYAELAPRNFSMTRSMFLSIGYSELPVISALFPRIVYDSATYAEWATNTKGFVRYFYDSMTYAELQLTNSTFIKTLYESVAYSELISRTLVLGRNFYDTATYAESAVRNSTFLRAFYDTFTYAERQTNNFVFGRTIYDSATYSELQLKNSTFIRTLYDAGTYAESVVRQSAFTRAFYDSMTYAEWQLKNSTFILTLYDSATYAELASRASLFSKTLYDYATYVESVVISVAKVYTQTLYDYATYAELVVKTVIFQRTFYDSAAYSELQTRSVMILRSIYDSVTYAESAIRQINIGRAFYDSIAYAESIATSVFKVYFEILYDSLSYADWASGFRTFTVFIYDSITYAESLITQFIQALMAITAGQTSVVFPCNATSQTGDPFVNVSLYLTPPSGWTINETHLVTGITNATNFTKLLSAGTYNWNCEWCTDINCSSASQNQSVIVNLPSPTGGGLALNIGGDLSMIEIIVVAMMCAVFAYLSTNQKAKEWKLAFFILSLLLMWVALVLSIEELSTSNQMVTSSVYNPVTNTYNFTYGNVTDTTPQQTTLASMLTPIWWVIYLVLAFALIELVVNLINYMRKGWV